MACGIGQSGGGYTDLLRALLHWGVLEAAFDAGGDDEVRLAPPEAAGEGSDKGSGPGPESAAIPAALPLLPLANTVLFPAMVVPLQVNRQSSVILIDDTLKSDNRHVGVVTQRHETEQDDGQPELHAWGTVAKVLKMLRYPDDTMMILVRGVSRFRIDKVVQEKPYRKAQVTLVDSEQEEESVELEALTGNLTNQFRSFVEKSPHLNEELLVAMSNINDASHLADFVASNLNVPTADKQRILETLNVGERLRLITSLLNREIEVLELGQKIQNQVQNELSKSQREYYLREQIKAIQQELGEDDSGSSEVDELQTKLLAANLPPEVYTAANKELQRLARMHQGSSEYSVVRTYLDWILDLPWSRSTRDRLDIERGARILDEDHYDLKRVKDRILEHLAVRKLKRDSRGSILCLVGPPGVGKTSLGRSIARAMGRKFVRMSLGGVHDEAEIRGHRRTYVGALPGRILQGLRQCESNNPVFMLDEIDKLDSDFRGDPASALLEVLDSEQNNSFSDHYLDLAFDLSRVFFICTANVEETIPAALHDRMETISVPGYTVDQKIQIAQQYLEPKVLESSGLKSTNLAFTRSALQKIITGYTREAGLRNLEREMASIARKTARRVASGDARKTIVRPATISRFLGAEKFYAEVAERTSLPGVATGLAWTPTGGDILFVEATFVPGNRHLRLTGKLGDVMQESAQAAYTILQARAEALGISKQLLDKHDLHVHVPAGAIPKDGPSAGVALLVAMVSLATGRPVRLNVAMTGEITLRGKVLPVGGIREKVLAARRAGIETVVLPKHNRKDLDELEPPQRRGLHFAFADSCDEALEQALEPARPKRKPASRANKRKPRNV